MAGPWRQVAKVNGYYEGRGGVLGPDTSRRTRWWELDLECGHRVERTARYRPRDDGWPTQRGGTQHRSADAVLPAPAKVRCEFCRQLV